MIKKQFNADLKSSAKGFTATLTTACLDRDNEIVIPDGMNSKEYDTNPLLLWNHDATKPVGKCVGLTRKTGSIVGDFEFAQRPDGFEGSFFPEFVAALVGQGIVRGVSICCIPEQNGSRMASDLDRKKYGDTVRTVHSRWKLIEVSLAPLQANPEALVTAVKKGMLRADDVSNWLQIPVAKPKRVTITLPAVASRKSIDQPMDLASIVRVEMARAMGKISL